VQIKEELLDLYTDYLISSFEATTTGLLSVLSKRFLHQIQVSVV